MKEQNAINIRRDNDPSVVIMRKIANITAKIFVKTKITPNQITVFNFILFVPLILYFFVRGSYQDILIGFVLIVITLILDLCDGIVARLKSISSNYGAWLDASLDTIFQGSLLVAITIGVYRISGTENILFWGLFMIFGQNMANVMGGYFNREFDFDAYSGNKSFDYKFSLLARISFKDNFFRNIIVPTNIIYIAIFTARYLLTAGILFNKLCFFIFIFTITINIRWIIMYYLYYKYLKSQIPHNKSNILSFLKELHDEKMNFKK